MPRSKAKTDDLAAVTARREALLAELAEVDERAKALEAEARDAGRTVLLSALEKVKIAGMEKAEARTIANAIAKHGGKRVADHLASIAGA